MIYMKGIVRAFTLRLVKEKFKINGNVLRYESQVFPFSTANIIF